jgi:signal transduction histidine kinase
MNLSSRAALKYRYMLAGFDEGWSEPVTTREAIYTNLSPGSYRFRLLAGNGDDLQNQTELTIPIAIEPQFWQTWWFLAVCVLSFVLFVLLAFRVRMYQVNKRFSIRLEERVEERTRIARELHDTLLQSFHGLLPRLQAACKLLPGRVADARQILEAALEDAAQAVTQAREAVQGLRAATVVTNDLAKAIESVGKELAADQETAIGEATAFSMEVEGTPRALHPMLRDDIYRIAAEAVRNAFRHARARRIEVEIIYETRQLRVRVRDNGIGIDASVIEEGRPGHFGLAGMRERARRIGGQLEVWCAASLSKSGALSTPGAGTEVQLIIPASVLYRNHGSRRFRLFRSKVSTNS